MEDTEDCESIKAELERRRSLLATLALNLNAKIDKTDRENIIRYIKE